MSWWLARAAMTVLTMLPITIGSVLEVAGYPVGATWVAFGILASLAAGVYATWVLLVEIMR